MSQAVEISKVVPPRVIAGAVRIFAARGLDASSLADLARAAGLSNAGLLHHVPSKAHLYRPVLSAAETDLRERLLTAVDGLNSPEARLTALLEAQRLWALERPEAARLLLRELMDNSARVADAHVFPLASLLDMIEQEVAAVLVSRGETRATPLAVAITMIGSLAYAAAVHPTLARLRPGGTDLGAWLGDVTAATALMLED